jgi:hypothetical protein
LSDVSEFWIVGVSLRKHRSGSAPVDGERGIIPKNAVFVGWGIVIAAFIQKLNDFCQREKTVRKSDRDVDLILRLGTEVDAGPVAEMWRTEPDVDDYVQSFALDDTTELGLGVLELIVKAAKSSAGGDGVIVLKEGVVDAEGGELGLVVGFEEGAACVAIDYGTQFIDTWEGGFDPLHL